MRKNDLQTAKGRIGTAVYYGDIDSYKEAFLVQHVKTGSWRTVAKPYNLYPNMARMISQGHDPGNKIRELLRLPMKDRFEVCPNCENPKVEKHRCSKGNPKKRNRLSINLDNPGSAARSIMKYMGRDNAEALIEMLMEEQINVLLEG